MTEKPGQVDQEEGLKQPSTRDRLIDAGMELFHAKGYNGVGVAEILKTADARSGSFYHYFPTKEDLLIAVLAKYDELLWPVVFEPAFAPARDPIERVFSLMAWYRNVLVKTDCRQGCPIGNLALEIGDVQPRVRERLAELFDAWSAGVHQCLDEAGGQLPADVDRTALADFVLIVMEGGLMLARAQSSLAPFDAAVGVLRDYFDRLLANAAEESN